MISRFLVCIRGGLGSLFPRPYLSGGLTPFGEEEEQKKEGEHILHPLPHPHTRPSLAPLHRHAHSRASVMILLVPSLHFRYPHSAGA